MMVAEAVSLDILSATIVGPACLLTGKQLFRVAGRLMDASTDDFGRSEGNPGARRTQTTIEGMPPCERD
jgi:hypothetical protein